MEERKTHRTVMLSAYTEMLEEHDNLKDLIGLSRDCGRILCGAWR